MPDIREFLDKKFLEWQNQMGEPMKQKEFAKFIGVKPSTYSSWVNDGVIPEGENLYRLADKLGYEVFEIVGASPPPPMIELIRRARLAYDSLPPDAQAEYIDRLNRIVQDTLNEYGAKRQK